MGPGLRRDDGFKGADQINIYLSRALKARFHAIQMAARPAAICRFSPKIKYPFLHRVYAPPPSLYKVFRPFSLTFSPTKTNLSEGVNGHCIYRGDRRLCSDHLRICVRLRCPGRRQAMNLFYVIGAVAAAGLMVYLVIALLKAENL